MKKKSVLLFVIMSIVSWFSALAQTDKDSLVLYIDFDSTELLDRSIHKHDVTQHNTVIGKGLIGRGLVFNGIDSYLEIKNRPSLSIPEKITMSLWYRHQTQKNNSSFYSLIEQSADEFDGHSRYGIWLRGNEELWVCIEPDQCENNTTLCQRCVTTKIQLSEDQWYHVAGTYNGTELKLFLDGQVIAEKEYLFKTGISVRSFPLTIGTDIYDSRPVFLNGSLDEIRLYKKALSEKQLQEYYSTVLAKIEVEQKHDSTTIPVDQSPVLSTITNRSMTKPIIIPNPASERITFSRFESISKVILIDSKGREERILTLDNGTLPVNQLNPGVYLLLVITKDETYHYQKLIIK